MSGATRAPQKDPKDRGGKDQGQGSHPKPTPHTPDPSQGQSASPHEEDLNEDPEQVLKEQNEDAEAEADAGADEDQPPDRGARPEPPEIDRARLGLLLRDGQRYALHVRNKVHLPELSKWAEETQKFMNEFGL